MLECCVNWLSTNPIEKISTVLELIFKANVFKIIQRGVRMIKSYCSDFVFPLKLSLNRPEMNCFKVAIYFRVYSHWRFHYQDPRMAQIPNAAKTRTHKGTLFVPQAFDVSASAFFWIWKFYWVAMAGCHGFKTNFPFCDSVVAYSVCNITASVEQQSGSIKQSLQDCFNAFLECSCWSVHH